MGEFTGIAWTDSTFNPWIGCTKVSPGCQYCYAERETFVRKEKAHGHILWGSASERHRTSEDYWRQPLKWNNEIWWQCGNCAWRGHLSFASSSMNCPMCLTHDALHHTRRRVFVASLADVFDPHPALDPWRSDLIDLIKNTPGLDWLMLTKRPELAGEMLPTAWNQHRGGWPSNLWLGTSAEDQRYYDQRVPELMKLLVPVKFISLEPMLGPISIAREAELAPHWVIVGGESGPRARPFDWDWARAVRDTCLHNASPIAFFMKQGGGYPDKRDDIDTIPADLRIREWPEAIHVKTETE